MSLVNLRVLQAELNLGNSNGNGHIEKDPCKGPCPLRVDCRNYMVGAYDCETFRNMSFFSSGKFACYGTKGHDSERV